LAVFSPKYAGTGRGEGKDETMVGWGEKGFRPGSGEKRNCGKGCGGIREGNGRGRNF